MLASILHSMKKIEEVLTNYIKTENADYSILINGDWGSGKSFFYEHSIKKLIAKEKYKPIYISLNGISDISSLQTEFFLKIISALTGKENKTMLVMGKLFSNVANVATKFFLKSTVDDIVKDIKVDSFNYSNYVICFDDLERCKLPIDEILGFINNYVEHHKLKTIIIGNEKEIAEQEKYHQQKEKVVGRVLSFQLDSNTILDAILSKYEQHSDFSQLLENNRKYVQSILIEYEISNLRTLLFGIDCLRVIHQKIGDKTTPQIIFFTILISFAFKNGAFAQVKLNEPTGLDSIDYQFISLLKHKDAQERRGETEEKDEKQNPKEVFLNLFARTYLYNRVDEYQYFHSIFLFINTGYFDSELLSNELKELEPKVVSPEVDELNTLINPDFRKLTDDEFEKLLDDVWKKALDGVYNIYNYAQIFNYYKFFSDKGIFNLSTQEILENIIVGLDKARKSTIINEFLIENLMHFASDTPELEEVKKKIKSIHDDLQQEKFDSNASEFIEALEKGPNELKEQFLKYSVAIPIFKYIKAENMFRKMLKADNETLLMLDLLINDRYRSVNIGEFLHEEIPTLVKLKNLVDDHLKKSTLTKLKKIHFDILRDQLEKVSNHLKATMKK